MIRTLASLLFLFATSNAWAYYGVLDNGEVLASGHYKLTGDLQALTDSGGINGAIRADMGIQDEYGIRALVGAGHTDYFLGALFKWMPIPDIEGGQPAIGFNVGLLYGKTGDVRDLTLRFEPLVSKKFKTGTTVWTPYASLPLGLRSRDSDDDAHKSDIAFQLVAGTQLQIEKWKNLQFIGEVGVELANAPSHVSIGAVFYFDEEKGFVLE